MIALNAGMQVIRGVNRMVRMLVSREGVEGLVYLLLYECLELMGCVE